MKKAILLIVLGLAVSVFPSCGGGSNDNPTPVPTPAPAPVTTSLYSQGFSIIAAPAGRIVWGTVDVAVPYAGTVTAAFDWTFASSDIDMVVTTTAACLASDGSGAYTGTCTALGADRGLGKPARVTFSMSGAGTIRIFLFSFASVPESGVLNVTIVH